MNYPQTKRLELVEEHFGHTISDPYRWLEADARHDPEVAGWIEAQNRLAQTHLDALPGRNVLRRRLIALFDYARLTAPVQRGGRYFFTRNPGLEAQPALVMREGLGGSDRVLIDPNAWEQGSTTALAEWAPSEDGQRIAFAVQEGGTDWRTIRVVDVDNGATPDDTVQWARFTNIAWAGDGSGFFYSRYPAPAGSAAADARLAGHAVYFHALGTPQQQDRLVYATPDQPHLVHVAGVTDDGRYATIYSSPGSGGSAPTVVDLTSPQWPARTLVTGFDHDWSIVGNLGTRFILTTQQDAARGKIVTIDLGDAQPAFGDLIPEKNAVLNDAALLGRRLVVSYLVDAKTQVERYRLDGTPDGAVELPGIGSAGGFRGRAIDNEAFFVFTSYDAPTTICRYDVSTRARTVWAQPQITADVDRIVVEQRFYASKDGTPVPMFVIRRKDIRGPAATLLYAYGGYGISNMPVYSPAWLAWAEQGGVVAVANVRGGGEYGKRWHDAGRLLHKQNSFDDCIAAGEYLKAEGIASPQGLVIHGESNGGLLVGAVVNQRPDLFAAALAGVGVMDMLRFDRFTGGTLWLSEFGDPDNEADFCNLLGYSPYHNVRDGKRYPAVLVTTADADNRVVPAHSFKYIAALQAAGLGERPRLVRIDKQAGHGAGKPTDRVIEELVDLWAFAAHWTGLTLK